MAEKLRILMVEDNPGDADLNAAELEEEKLSFEWRRVETKDEFRRELESFKPDIILSDYRLPRFDGLSALRLARRSFPFIPFIIVSGALDEEAAIALLREGAADYILKQNITRLGSAVGNALALRNAREERARAEEELKRSYAELERRVRERTQELTEANAKLTREIEERARTEKALEESEERFRSVLDNSLDAAYRRDLRTDRYDYMSPVIERITGFTAEEFSGFSMTAATERIHPDDLPRVERLLEGTVSGGRDAGIIDYRFKAKNGEYRWLADNVKVVRDADGHPAYRIGMVRDITDRKRIEDELRRKEEEFRSLAENLPDVVARFDRQLRHVYINPAGARAYGMRQERITGRTYGELGWTPAMVELWESHLRAALGTGSEQSYEFDYESAEGAKTYAARLVPEYDAAGGKTGVLAIFHDITRLKEIERRLSETLHTARVRADEAEERQRLLQAIIENMPDGLIVVEAPNGELRMVSDFIVRLSGIGREQLLAMTLHELNAKLLMGLTDGTVGGEQGYPLMRAIVRGETVVNEEREIVGADGKRMTLLINARPVHGPEGKITGGIASWRDITARKQMEDTLRRNEYELRTLVDNSPDLIVRFDRAGRYVYVNPAYERITGLAKERFAGKTNAELGMEGGMAAAFDVSLRKVVATGREDSLEFEFQGFFGKRYFWGRMIPEFAKSGLVETVMLIARDVTERRKAEEQVRYISFHDQVTGLYNRAFFEEEMHRVDNGRSLPISIIMGDVNNLKLTNDTFGHEEGDRLLRKIGEVLRRACRGGDIISRWGGDEFTVILPKTENGTAQEVIGRIAAECRAVKELLIPPSIALGTDTKNSPGENIYRTLRNAEERMYRNKAEHARENRELVIASIRERLTDKRPELGEHLRRLKDLIAEAASALSLSAEQVEALATVAELHELGKIVVPDAVWLKEDRLDAREWQVMKGHRLTSYRIARSFGDYAPLADLVGAVDERWDGGGYPNRIGGEAIPYLSRVFAVLDAFDVMTHTRPYAPALSREEALEELRRGAGRQFDPAVVGSFTAWAAGAVAAG